MLPPFIFDCEHRVGTGGVEMVLMQEILYAFSTSDIGLFWRHTSTFGIIIIVHYRY